MTSNFGISFSLPIRREKQVLKCTEKSISLLHQLHERAQVPRVDTQVTHLKLKKVISELGFSPRFKIGSHLPENGKSIAFLNGDSKCHTEKWELPLCFS